MNILYVSMEIQLNGKNGGVALVSEDDYAEVIKYKWYQDDYGYVRGTINGKGMAMHRFIIKPPDDKLVDHINHNRLDNRQENLRIACIYKNNANKGKAKNKSSQYKNVYLDKKKNKFRTQISVNHKTYHLGIYDNEIEAAEAVDMYIVHNKLDYIELNFPEKRDAYLERDYVSPKTQKRSTQYEGVQKQGNKYITNFRVNGKNIYLGSSKNQIKCAKKYDAYIVQNNIKGRKLNFPENYPNYEIRKLKHVMNK